MHFMLDAKAFAVKRIFLFAMLFMAGINCLSILKDLSSSLIRPSQKNVKYPGYEFGDLRRKIPAAVSEIGFLTNKDMSPERNDGQFLAAQCMLAPIVLDLDNPHHEFIILDYTDIPTALNAMEKYNIQTLYINGYGKILGRGK